MEFKILEEKENPLLNRKELVIEITHEKEPTPKRREVRGFLVGQGYKENLIVIRKIESYFGKVKSKAFVNIYKREEDKIRYEPKWLLDREVRKSGQKEEGKQEEGKESSS